MSKKLALTIKILVTATFLVPFVLVSSKFIFPFIVPKILVFRTLTLLMLGTYVVLLASDYAKYRPRVTLINISVAAFFFSFFVSTFVGVDWYKSFWDNHERMLGLFTFFHYVIYFFIVTSVVKDWREWKWLLRIFLLAGMVVMIIGGLQKLNPELLLNRGSGRVSATLGNAIYFSGYGLFLFFIGLLLAVKEPIRFRSLWFWYAVVGSIFGLAGIFWGQTRGTLLGLIVASAPLFLGYLFTLREAKKVRLVLTAFFLFGVAGLSLLFVFRKSETVSQIPLLGSLLNSSLTSATGQTRIMAWQIALEAAKEKPVFGWGPNNYYYAFNKYYRPEFLEHGWGETWFDNAHSAIFNTLAVQGFIGLLAYIALFVVSIFCLWRAWKEGRIDKHIFVIGAAFLVGHFVHNSTVFENPTSYLYFFFFLAFVNSISRCPDNPDIRIKEKKEKTISLALTVTVLTAVLFLIYSTNINVARANMASLRVLGAMQTGRMVTEAYQDAVKMSSPHIDDIRSDFVRSLILIIPQYNKAGLSDKAKELYQIGYEESKKNLVLHPLDIRTHLQFAQLIQLGVIELKNPPQSLVEAEAVLKDAMVKSPKRQQIVYQLSMLELLLNKPDESVALLQAAIADDEKVSESWWRLALVYAQSGRNDEAKETIKTAQDKGLQFNEQGQAAVVMIIQADQKSK